MNLAARKGLTQRVFYRSKASTNAVVLVEGPVIFSGFSLTGGATSRWVRFYDLNRTPLASDEPSYVTKSNVSSPNNSTGQDIFFQNGIAIRMTVNGAPPTAFWDDTPILAEEVVLILFYRRVAS